MSEQTESERMSASHAMPDGEPPVPTPADTPVVARPVQDAWPTIGALVAARPVAPLPLDLSMVPRRDVVWDLMLVAVVTLILPLGLQSALGRMASESVTDTLPPLAALRLSKWFSAAQATLLLAYIVYRSRVPAQAFGLQANRLGRQLLAAPATLIATYLAMLPTVIIATLVVLLFPSARADLQDRLRFVEFIGDQTLLESLVLMIPVAIHEEIIFRAVLIPCLRRLGLGWVGAVIVSSLVFASLHGAQGWLGVSQIFFIGLALGTAFVRSRSLLAVILAHLAFNVIQVQISQFVLRYVEHAGGLPS